ncbi:MAG: FliA/WhiG family RNA polymerase sigma factor [Desulfobacterales bacterium]|nr:FliA/WhiG family RNA polymerase sigma factor [Desulfobacterales bacterium]
MTVNGKKQPGFDRKTRDEMIVRYAPLVKYIAGRISMRLPSSVLFEELLSAGCVGLIDAIDKFDTGRDVDIKTYAEYRIRGAILDELRSLDWYSRPMRKKIQDIEKAVTAVEARVGRPAEDTEVAEQLGIELEAYFHMLSSIHGVALLSLDDYIKSEDKDRAARRSYKDRLSNHDDPSDNIAREELKRVIATGIKRLSEKEQVVISLYYFDELTLKEIGHVLDLTESRICQIHSMALIKLKLKLKHYFAE